MLFGGPTHIYTGAGEACLIMYCASHLSTPISDDIDTQRSGRDYPA